MKEKIIARLKAKFSGVNLSNARLDAIADKLASKITDENLIDAKLDELNDISPFSEIAKYDDWQRSKESKEKAEKEKADKDAKEKADKEKADSSKNSNDSETTKMLKELLESNRTLTQRLESFEAGKTAESHSSKLLSQLKEKKVPESYYGPAIFNRSFKDENEVTSFANTLVEAYGKFHQDEVIKGLKDQPAPVMGVVKDEKNEVSPGMQDYVKEKQAAKKSA